MIRPISALAPAVALAALLATPALAQTAPAPTDAAGDIGGAYAIDPSHSHIVFSYDHVGFSISHGVVNGVTGTITLDAADPSKSTVEASFPLGAMHTVDPQLDKDLLGKEFFNGAAPDTQVTFKSTSVEVKDDDEAKVTGDLTLNGVTKPVTLDVELRKAGVHPMEQKPAVGFEVEGELKRSDFNLGAFAPAVSDEVEIRIWIEALKG